MNRLTLLGLVLLAVASQGGMAQTTASSSSATPATALRPADKLVADYSAWAGSDINAKALVNGLRTGKEIILSDTAIDGSVTTTSFSPTTKPMGYGNIKNALALTQAQLASQGITNPTAAQLQSALVGGSGQQGILQMRTSGMGWGQIANSLGVKLGPVVSGKPSAIVPATTTSTTTASGKSVQGGVVNAEGGNAAGSAAASSGKGSTTSAAGAHSSGVTTGVGQGNAYGRAGVVSPQGAKTSGGNAYGKGGKP